ncbi:MAG: MFS transporter [Hyphomicrobiaceae bacterium]
MNPSWLAPFRVRSFRYQWPADLVTAWAIEMETLILGWYVLVETGSVLTLTIFGASLYFGTLIAPMLGVVGDRAGHRGTLVVMRLAYMVLATLLMTLAFSGALTPYIVIAIGIVAGLLKPSDLAIRSALIASTVPSDMLTGAMGIARTTMDSARIAGALAGAGLFAAWGLGAAYIAVTALYLLGVLLTLGTGTRPGDAAPALATASDAPAVLALPSPVSFWRDLKDGLAFVWSRPVLRAAMWLALLVNFTAFPLSNGLLPYVAREVYFVNEKGLGYLAASYASGALIGSILFSRYAFRVPLARVMLAASAGWYLALLLFGQMISIVGGMGFLFLAGLLQSLSMIAVAVLILRITSAELRGRVMGVRILAIYSLPFGLLFAGWLIQRIGFAATASTYALFGLAMVLLLAARFHGDLWRVEAPANAT